MPETDSTCPTPYLDITEAAARLKLSVHTLNKWRHLGTGPQFRDHGRRIVYHIDELDFWSEQQKRQKAKAYGDQNSDKSLAFLANEEGKNE